MKTTMQRSGAGASPAKQVLARAAAVALILGSTLTLINQSDAIFGAAEIRWLPLTLVYLTPFLVVGVSQVLGIRAARRALARMTELRENFLGTIFSHGIPARAIVLGLVASGVNSAIVASEGLLAGGGLSAPPVPLIAQALVLPAMFGALSQAISFRRAMRRTARR